MAAPLTPTWQFEDRVLRVYDHLGDLSRARRTPAFPTIGQPVDWWRIEWPGGGVTVGGLAAVVEEITDEIACRQSGLLGVDPTERLNPLPYFSHSR